MGKDEYDDYERRSRLYYNAFEEYDSLNTTYKKFYEASDSYNRRGIVLTYGSTILGAFLLFIIGVVVVEGGPDWGTDIALGLSILVAGLSYVNAVDSPQRMSNVSYNAGQSIQRVYLEFHYFVTVRLPDPDENLFALEREYERLLEKKNMVNETTPQLSSKWYDRVKENQKKWKPSKLENVTGEDKEFEIEADEEDKNNPQIAWDYTTLPFRRLIRWLGY